MRARRLVLRIGGGLAAVALLAAAGGYWYERPLLLTGTGYAAHNSCAVQFVAGRRDPATDLPANPLVPYLRGGADAPGQSASATVLGLSGQQAWYTPDFGCTLAAQRPALGAATPVSATADPLAGAAPPGADAELDAAVGRAFGDDLALGARTTLGTRAVVVLHDGRLVAERYAPGFQATTRQLGWSMAKSVTNLLVGTLVRQGALAVTEDHLLPAWSDARSTITVDELMRMSSGLSWDETYDLGTTITEMLYLRGDMGGFAAEQPPAHPPGSYQQYSSGSTNILCSVLHRRTGVGADLPRRQLFAPLGLASAVWEPDAAGTPVCSSYLWATPRDWAAIGQFALQDGSWGGRQLLPAGWLARSTTVVATTASEERGYAAGWWVNRLPDGSLVHPELPADAYWADGHDGQRLYVVPSAKLVVVRLGFSPTIDDDTQLRTSGLVHDLVRHFPGG
jgi:CubicO group peptidase (beta-lactamase class C family)